jgi:acetyl esterase
MVAVVTQHAKERRGPTIKFQVLFYPVTDASLSQKSYEEFADGPWLTTAAMVWFWDAYAPNKEDRKKPTATPLSATIEQLQSLPPALVLVDEYDVLRDEGEEYARKLTQTGVDVTAARFLATHHDFAMSNSLADTPAARAAIQLASQKLTEVLGKLMVETYESESAIHTGLGKKIHPQITPITPKRD